MSRITTGTMTVGILAILAGLVGAYILRMFLVKEETVAPPPQFIEVPLAAADLPGGRIIARGDMAIHRMSVADFNRRFSDRVTLIMTSPDQFIGRTLTDGVKLGEPFLTTGVYLEGTGPDITKNLKEGFRAVSITVTDRSAVLPTPGNLVDIVFRTRPSAARPNGLPIPEATMTLFHGVDVLAVNRPTAASVVRNPNVLDVRLRSADTTPPPPTVTVALTSEQANQFKAAQLHGDFTLVVRGPAETRLASYNPKKYTIEEVLGLEPPPPPPPTPLPIPPVRTDIYRGGARQTNLFSRDQLIHESFGGSRPITNGNSNPVLPPANNNNSSSAPLLPPPATLP